MMKQLIEQSFSINCGSTQQFALRIGDSFRAQRWLIAQAVLVNASDLSNLAGKTDPDALIVYAAAQESRGGQAAEHGAAADASRTLASGAAAAMFLGHREPLHDLVALE